MLENQHHDPLMNHRLSSIAAAASAMALAGGAVPVTFAADPVTADGQSSDRGPMPSRVHVFEDYETEIEKRWWLRGVPELEKKDLAPALSASVPNTRACRAAETKDFDDKQGDPAKKWKAVIFNPVPGPPMGPNTRLNFRYRLTGADSLRVQIYSLSNGYHRQLVLKDLPRDAWQTATVDMTQLRCPNSTGGPLAADERIDDIQFYIAPEADLLIDDIVLYEAAPPEEKTPFPRRIIFTGWFDTGKQGAEWPGDFEIMNHEAPLTWKCAKSVARPATDTPWIRVGLRGRRPLSSAVRLRFHCRLTGSGLLTVKLADTESGTTRTALPVELKPDAWTTASVNFSGPSTGAFADELHFVVPAGGTLLLDDVLLFEPVDDGSK